MIRKRTPTCLCGHDVMTHAWEDACRDFAWCVTPECECAGFAPDEIERERQVRCLEVIRAAREVVAGRRGSAYLAEALEKYGATGASIAEAAKRWKP